MDILTKEQRSALMSRIRGKDTGIELAVRYALHAKGLRYRLGGAGLPGRPDLVFPRYKAVVFVHGCFWHGHDCALFRLPKTRPDFWEAKICANRQRDARVIQDLRKSGWRTFVVWECKMRKKSSASIDHVIDCLAKRIQSGSVK